MPVFLKDIRCSGAGVSREFRIVRDNRVNQKTTENLAANKDAKTEPVQNSSLGIQQVNPDTVERRYYSFPMIKLFGFKHCLFR